jgi:lipopolysaccharide transport system ATP-binding protein
MIMRLGFSIAIHANPACLIVDEALAVGDARFQQKCLDWMRRFQQRGGALLFVSHDLAAIKQLCQRAIVLDQGKVVYEGDALSACNYYETSLVDVKTKVMKQSDGFVQLLACRWLDHEGQEIMPTTGQYVELSLALNLNETLYNMSLGFMIRDRLGQDLIGSNTQLLNASPEVWHRGRLEVCFPMTMNLTPGEYVLFIALHDAVDYTKNVELWQQTAENFTVVSADSQVSVGQVYCALQPPTWRSLS